MCIIHFEQEVESLGQDGNIACLVEANECGLSLTVKILAKRLIRIRKQSRHQSIDVNCSLCKQLAKYQKRQHKVTVVHKVHRYMHKKRKKHSIGKSQPMSLTHRTGALLLTTCLHRSEMHLLSSASRLWRTYDNGSMTVLPPKSNKSFYFGMTSRNRRTYEQYFK